MYLERHSSLLKHGAWEYFCSRKSRAYFSQLHRSDAVLKSWTIMLFENEGQEVQEMRQRNRRRV